jgi:SLAP domain-containing protein
MISFLKKWRSVKPENEAEQPVIQKEQQVEEEASEGEEVQGSFIKLILPENEWGPLLEADESYVFRFAFSELPELEPGVFAIDGYKLEQTTDGFFVLGFLRNNLDEPVELEQVPVVLKDAGGAIIARQLFNVREEMKVIPAQSGMPWRFVFPYASFAASSGDLSAWRLEFHMQDGKTQSRVQTLEFDLSGETWIEQQARIDEQIATDIHRAFIKTEGLVHAIGANTVMKDNGELEVLVALRNSRDEAVLLEADTVFTVHDATGEAVASHSFDLSNVELPAYSATPYTLVFPQSSVRKQNPDFSEWSIVQE